MRVRSSRFKLPRPLLPHALPTGSSPCATRRLGAGCAVSAARLTPRCSPRRGAVHAGGGCRGCPRDGWPRPRGRTAAHILVRNSVTLFLAQNVRGGGRGGYRLGAVATLAAAVGGALGRGRKVQGQRCTTLKDSGPVPSKLCPTVGKESCTCRQVSGGGCAIC